MKKILLIDDSDTYTWCLQKYLQHRGYPVKTASTLKEARAAIQEEMPLVVCCDLDLPDGSGMDFLDEVRAADKELPFILASCHDKDDYEQEAMRKISWWNTPTGSYPAKRPRLFTSCSLSMQKIPAPKCCGLLCCKRALT